MKDWKGICHRCGKKTGSHIMSMFNTDLICMGCLRKEKARKDYQEARDAEHEALKSGDRNFPGVGFKP